jgi:ketosteroid isomerase-like protein
MKTLAAVVVGLVASACAVAPSATEQDVVDAVQALFDGMRARDPEAVRAMLCDDAQFLSVAVVDGRAVPRPSTAAAFLASLGSGDEPWVERMFAPEVDVRGDFAFAQMDYDFHRGAAFSHHGVDQFLLVREQGRWRVASIVYSVVRGDAASPFGGL